MQWDLYLLRSFVYLTSQTLRVYRPGNRYNESAPVLSLKENSSQKRSYVLKLWNSRTPCLWFSRKTTTGRKVKPQQNMRTTMIWNIQRDSEQKQKSLVKNYVKNYSGCYGAFSASRTIEKQGLPCQRQSDTRTKPIKQLLAQNFAFSSLHIVMLCGIDWLILIDKLSESFKISL